MPVKKRSNSGGERGRFTKGDPRMNRRGRPKGAQNKATTEHKEWLRQCFDDPKYRAMFQRKLYRGTLPPNIWQDALNRAHGKPATTIEAGKGLLELLLAQGAKPATPASP